MPGSTIYLLDSDVFIEAKNLHYGLDFCPAFWEWLLRHNSTKQVFSIEKVESELLAGSDELSTWAGERGDGFFLVPDEAIVPALASVSAWATTYTWPNGQRYTPAAVNTFLQVADYYLVAYALAHKHVVVTHEKPAASVNKIKIPNACISLGIKCMSPYVDFRTFLTRAQPADRGKHARATSPPQVRR